MKESLFESIVDIAAIAAIAFVAVETADVSAMVVGALASIALGKRYMANRAG